MQNRGSFAAILHALHGGHSVQRGPRENNEKNNSPEGEQRCFRHDYFSFCPASMNAPRAKIDGTHTPTYIPLSLSDSSLPAKYNEMLKAKLAAADTRNDTCKITFGFMFEQ
jgi:hypothetical protein